MVHGVLESDEDESWSQFIDHIEHSEHLSQLLTLVFLLFFNIQGKFEQFEAKLWFLAPLANFFKNCLKYQGRIQRDFATGQQVWESQIFIPN